MISITDIALTELCKAAGFYPVTRLARLAGGIWSTAYAITCGGKEYVVRINRNADDFRKEKGITRFLQQSNLPIPQIVATGNYIDYYYAVSERCAGYTMIDKHVNDKNVINLFECLLQLQNVDVTHLQGWGFINDNLRGNYNSWEETLLCFHNHKMDYTIEGLINKGVVQKEIVAKAMDKIQSLLPFCNIKKQLVHGDFGFDNALTDGKEITGIIDWAEARLGDFLYDVAYLIFNTSGIDYKNWWQQFVQAKGLKFHYMNERLLCYQLVIGLNSIAIAAHLNKQEAYREDLEKLKPLL